MPTATGARIVPMPSRGSARSARPFQPVWKNFTRSGLAQPLRVGTTRAPLNNVSRPPSPNPLPNGEGFHVPCVFGNSSDGIGRTVNRITESGISKILSPGERTQVRAGVTTNFIRPPGSRSNLHRPSRVKSSQRIQPCHVAATGPAAGHSRAPAARLTIFTLLPKK